MITVFIWFLPLCQFCVGHCVLFGFFLCQFCDGRCVLLSFFLSVSFVMVTVVSSSLSACVMVSVVYFFLAVSCVMVTVFYLVYRFQALVHTFNLRPQHADQA